MQTVVLIHSIFASLFLLDYVIKTILLLGNKTAGLEKYKKISKVPSMIVSTVFLVTGIYLIVQIGMKNIGGWFHLKISLVVIGLVLGIIAFKKGNKALALVSVILFLYVYGISETKDIKMGIGKPRVEAIEDTTNVNYDLALHGKKIYINECARCHGETGNAQLLGATDLTESSCSHSFIVIKKGRGTMPAFENILTEQEIKAVTAYIKTLKKVS